MPQCRNSKCQMPTSTAHFATACWNRWTGTSATKCRRVPGYNSHDIGDGMGQAKRIGWPAKRIGWPAKRIGWPADAAGRVRYSGLPQVGRVGWVSRSQTPSLSHFNLEFQWLDTRAPRTVRDSRRQHSKPRGRHSPALGSTGEARNPIITTFHAWKFPGCLCSSPLG
jgi:hypothetical protein